LLQSATRSAEILIDDHNLLETQFPGSIAQSVLPLLPFQMKPNLVSSRLPHINVSRALQMLRPNFLVHRASRVVLTLTRRLATTARSVRGNELGCSRGAFPRGASWGRLGLFVDNLVWDASFAPA